MTNLDSNKQKLVGKVALITGASQGLGYQITKRFANEGANLIICSRSKNEIKDVVSELSQNFGNDHCNNLIKVISDNFDYLPTDLQQQSISKFNNLIDSIDAHGPRTILVLSAIIQTITNPEILKKISHKLTKKNSIIDYSNVIISISLI